MKNPQLKSLTWNLLLEWDDGVVAPIQFYMNTSMMADGKFTDSVMAEILTSHVRVFTEAVIQDGLEGLHEKGVDCGGEQPFSLLLSTMLDLLDGRYVRLNEVTGKPDLNRRQMVEHLRNYVRLIQATIRPAIPPEIWRLVEALKGQR